MSWSVVAQRRSKVGPLAPVRDEANDGLNKKMGLSLAAIGIFAGEEEGNVSG